VGNSFVAAHSLAAIAGNVGWFDRLVVRHAKWVEQYSLPLHTCSLLFPVLGFSASILPLLICKRPFSVSREHGANCIGFGWLLKLSDSLELGEWTLGILICAVLAH